MDYLGAALSEPSDAEAWVNTIVLAMTQVETAHIAEAALRSGSRLVGAGFREYLVRWTQAQAPDFPAEEMLTLIDEHLEQLELPARGGMLIRLLDAEGRIDELVLRDPDEGEP